MQIHINGTLRENVTPLIGGSLSQTSGHKTSSRIKLKAPADETVQECDYIKFKDGDSTVFSGLVSSAKQVNLGYSSMDMKIFDLNIAGNADFFTRIFVDMRFPAGASVTQILLGNHVDDEWYISSLPEFEGVYDVRIAPEGFTLGAIDNFPNVTLSDPAYLWGSYVYNVLDDLASAANSWWEVTADKVFSFRSNASLNRAPFDLDTLAAISDLSSVRDSYTLYSAVRVVGGRGKGKQIIGQIIGAGDTGIPPTQITIPSPYFERTSSTLLTLTYPVHSEVVVYQTSQMTEPTPMIRVGFKGLHDDDPDYQALTTYGGTEIEAKEGVEFFLPVYQEDFSTLFYFPLIPIVARLVDSDLAAEIKGQRGGTGVIEYLLSDSTITDFGSASVAAVSFLRDNAKRAATVSFKTQIPDISPGQVFKDSNVPYYGVIGDYVVTAVTAQVISSVSDELVWEYSVQASTVKYRDKLGALFYDPAKITFKLGSDVPATDGVYLNSEISVATELTMKAFKPMTWDELEALDYTWDEFESAYDSWDDFMNKVKEWSILANLLTNATKEMLASFLTGQSTPNLNLVNVLSAYDSSNSLISMMAPDAVIVNGNEIISVYTLNDTVEGHVARLDALNSAYAVLQTADVNIDKTATNPLGSFSLTITKRDSIL